MAIIIEKRINLDAPIKLDSLCGFTFTTESEAHRFVVRCDQNGQELTLTGTISAKFVRADGNTVELVGTIEDGKAVVTLAQDCYNVYGRFQLAIFNTVGNTKLCIYACIGTVQRAQSGNLIDGGGIIPDVENLIADIQAAIQSIPPTYDALLASIAGTYSATKTYAVGDYVWYDGSLYRCTTAIATGETWTSGHWTAAVLSDDLSGLKSALEVESYSSSDFVFDDYVIDTGIGKMSIMASSEYVIYGLAFPAYNAMNGKKSNDEIKQDNEYFFTDALGAWWAIFFESELTIKKIRIKNSYSTNQSYLPRSFDVYCNGTLISHVNMSDAFETVEIPCNVSAHSIKIQSDSNYTLGIGDFSFEYTVHDTFVSKKFASVANQQSGYYPVQSSDHLSQFGTVRISASSVLNNNDTFAAWHACDGVVEASDGHYFFTSETGAWWKIKLPAPIKLNGVLITNSYTNNLFYSKRVFDIYTDENMTDKFGETVYINSQALAQNILAKRLVCDSPVVTDTIVIKSDSGYSLGLSDVQLLYTYSGEEKLLANSENLMSIEPKALESNITKTILGDIVVSSSSVFNNNDTFAAWHACDGIIDTQTDGSYFFTSETGAWWKIKFPYKIRVTGITIRNSYSNRADYLLRNFSVYADDEKTILLGDQIQMTSAWQEASISCDVETDTFVVQSDENCMLGIGEFEIVNDGILINPTARASEDGVEIANVFSKAIKGRASTVDEHIIYSRSGAGMIQYIQLISPTIKYPDRYILDFDKVILRVYTDDQLYFSGAIFDLCGMGTDNHAISDYDDIVFYTPLFSKMGTRSNVILNYKIPYYRNVAVALYYPEGVSKSTFWSTVKDVPFVDINYGMFKIPYGAYLHSDKIRNASIPFGDELTLIDTNQNGLVMSTSMFVRSGNGYFQEGCLRGYYNGTPVMLSSGLEDYFQFCHYFDVGVRQFPQNGLTFFEGNASGSSITTLCAYRNHLLDPIMFTSGGFQLKIRCGDAQGPVLTPSSSDNLVGTAPDNTDFGAQVTYYTWDDD